MAPTLPSSTRCINFSSFMIWRIKQHQQIQMHQQKHTHSIGLALSLAFFRNKSIITLSLFFFLSLSLYNHNYMHCMQLFYYNFFFKKHCTNDYLFVIIQTQPQATKRSAENLEEFLQLAQKNHTELLFCMLLAHWPLAAFRKLVPFSRDCEIPVIC